MRLLPSTVVKYSPLNAMSYVYSYITGQGLPWPCDKNVIKITPIAIPYQIHQYPQEIHQYPRKYTIPYQIHLYPNISPTLPNKSYSSIDRRQRVLHNIKWELDKRDQCGCKACQDNGFHHGYGGTPQSH